MRWLALFASPDVHNIDSDRWAVPICEDGTDEGSPVVECRRPTKRSKEDQWSTNCRPCSRTSTARREREPSPGLGPRFQGSARCGSRTPRSTSEGHTLVLSRMARTRRKPRVGCAIHGKQSMAWPLWICPRRAGPAAEERQGGDKEDKGTGRPTKGEEGWGTGGTTGGSVPSRRVSPFTLLSYEGGYHSRWPQRRREEGECPPLFFFFSPPLARKDGPGRRQIVINLVLWAGRVKLE